MKPTFSIRFTGTHEAPAIVEFRDTSFDDSDRIVLMDFGDGLLYGNDGQPIPVPVIHTYNRAGMFKAHGINAKKEMSDDFPITIDSPAPPTPTPKPGIFQLIWNWIKRLLGWD